MQRLIRVNPRCKPPLDAGYVPASLWNRAFREAVAARGGEELAVAVERPGRSVSVYRTAIFADEAAAIPVNDRYVERLVKCLLWQKGGHKITIAGNPRIARHIAGVYSRTGARAFDHEFLGDRVFGRMLTVENTTYGNSPEAHEAALPLGRHLDGCRIGFDLGGSDRKCSAVIDGEVVFTEEVTWDPYFQADPQYHYDEINDSLKRAAAKLPRVDAIGGSAAGVYVGNEIRASSLFRGVPADQFERRARRIFFDLQKAWGGIPFVVVNDGEVTALAGSMALGDGAVLGISMGTSQAGGYVTPEGNITDWLNELAFVPVDYREDAPVDEWSRDRGAGAQYFSQQAVSRLLPATGIEFPREMTPAEKLAGVQELMAGGDARAAKIYETFGVYLGYAIAQYADLYDLRHIMVLGRVLSGAGGDLLLGVARATLRTEFPEVAEAVCLHVPGETGRRHGQAVAAASLPVVSKS